MRSSSFYPIFLALGLTCASSALARMDGPASSTDQDSTVLHLGEVEVHGELNVTHTLQAIKVALTMPYSNDPKMANVMVCRLEDSPESHVKKVLTCGTNRTLALRRGALQSNFAAAAAQNSAPGTGSCMGTGCYTAVFTQLQETINSQPGNYLHQTVNGPALRSALSKVPMPTPDQPAAQKAPDAATKQ
jgi:hypothetical protein